MTAFRFIGKFARQKWGFEPTEPFLKGLEYERDTRNYKNYNLREHLRGVNPYLIDLLNNEKIKTKNPKLYENLLKLEQQGRLHPSFTLIPISLLKELKSNEKNRPLYKHASRVVNTRYGKNFIPELNIINNRSKKLYEKFPFLLESGFDTYFHRDIASKIDKTTDGDILESSLEFSGNYNRDNYKFIPSFAVNYENDVYNANAINKIEAIRKLRRTFTTLRHALENKKLDKPVVLEAEFYTGDGKGDIRVKEYEHTMGLKPVPNSDILRRTF